MAKATDKSELIAKPSEDNSKNVVLSKINQLIKDYEEKVEQLEQVLIERASQLRQSDARFQHLVGAQNETIKHIDQLRQLLTK